MLCTNATNGLLAVMIHIAVPRAHTHLSWKVVNVCNGCEWLKSHTGYPSAGVEMWSPHMLIPVHWLSAKTESASSGLILGEVRNGANITA